MADDGKRTEGDSGGDGTLRRNDWRVFTRRALGRVRYERIRAVSNRCSAVPQPDRQIGGTLGHTLRARGKNEAAPPRTLADNERRLDFSRSSLKLVWNFPCARKFPSQRAVPL